MEIIEIGEEVFDYNNFSIYNTFAFKKFRNIFIPIDDEIGKINYGLLTGAIGNCERRRLERKVELSRKLGSIVVRPTRKIYYNGQFVGHTKPFIDGINLNEYSVKNNEEYLKILKELSKFLKYLHENNIVLGDMDFRNVIINESGIYYIDIDEAGFKPYKPEAYSSKTCLFMRQYTRNESLIHTKDFDRLSLVIEFVCYHMAADVLSNDWFNGIRDYQYKELYQALNLRFRLLIDLLRNQNLYAKYSKSHTTPYLDDLIHDEPLFDSYINNQKVIRKDFKTTI